MTRLEGPPGTLVVADLDGTLTFTDGAPEWEVMAAWDALARVPGVRMVLATARAPVFVRDWFGQRLGQTDVVCCNGALVLPREGPIMPWALPEQAVRQVVQVLGSAEVSLRVDYGEYFVARGPDTVPWMLDAHRRPLAPGLMPHCAGVLRMLVSCSRRAHQAAHGLPGVKVIPHGGGDADLVAHGVGKETAVASLRRPGEQLVALGNDENDRELLRSADLAYVVGAGLPEVGRAVHRLPARPGSVAGALHALRHRLSRSNGRATAPAAVPLAGSR